MPSNGRDYYEDMLTILRRLDSRTEEQGNFVESVSTHIKTVAENTTAMAGSLRELQQENRSLIEIATGKRQVPMLIFLLVVGVISLLSIIDHVALSKLSVNLSPSNLSIEQKPHDR